MQLIFGNYYYYYYILLLLLLLLGTQIKGGEQDQKGPFCNLIIDFLLAN